MSSSIASSFLRRSSRCFFFSPSLLISKHRHYTSLSSTPLVFRALIPQTLSKNPSSISTRFASSKALSANDKIKRADENLLRVLESKIECADEEEADQKAALPKDFPIEIIDNPGDQVIILKCELADEKIEATVHMNFDIEGEDQDYEDDTEDDDNAGDALLPSVSLVVTIDKGSGRTLEFCCNVNPDEVEIESMGLKSSKDSEDGGACQGRAFSDLDESLQKALRLAVKGIKGSLHDFLREYMTSKDDKEYKAWLKNLKEFVKKCAGVASIPFH